MNVNTDNSILSRDNIRFEFDSIAKVKSTFDAQQKNLQFIKSRNFSERKKLLKALEKSILSHRKEIEEALFKDLKKHPFEVSYSEIFPTISEIRYIKRNLKKWMSSKSVPNSLPYIGSRSKVMMEPKGNCLIITPWNYPFYLSMSHLAVCIAAGNSAILKPSEFTPYTSILLKKILNEIFRDDEVSVVFAGADVTSEILGLSFDHIHFTGSTLVGKIIMQHAAQHLSSVTLELGGKSPVIIDENYNIKDCIAQIGWGKFLNAGQTCIAPDYMLVHESKRKEFVTLLSNYLADSFGNDPNTSDLLTGIINEKHWQRLDQLLKAAVKDGNEIVFGGFNDKMGLTFGPTLLLINDMNSEIMDQEIFGPILPIIEYNNVEEAINIINQKHKPLAMYLFSDSQKWIANLLNHTSSGGVSINDTMAHFVQTYLPMGGVNHSGIGKSHGLYGFKEFSNERSVLKSFIKGGITWPFHFPYTSLKKKILEILIKYF